jgi:acyl-CoA thioesterase
MTTESTNIPQTTPQAVLERMLAKDAFSRLLGLQVVAVGEGYCRLHFQVREEMLNGFGILHGGVSYAAADSAFAFACNSHGRLSVALSTTMEYLEAGRLGDTLTVEAREENLKHKIGVYQIRITNQEGVLLGLFKGTSYRTSKPI